MKSIGREKLSTGGRRILAFIVAVALASVSPAVTVAETSAAPPAGGGLAAPDQNAVTPPEADEAAQARKRDVDELCGLLMGAAARYKVPADFFIRLIWKESRFNAGAVSPVGAQGIAQFMPGTARLRGLKNPFDREEALHASASFLADMQARFGSWGLAAIGYNGGPNRVMPLVHGRSGLPYETIDYVFAITGRTYQYWAAEARRRLGISLETPLDAVPRPPARPADEAAGDASPENAPTAEADEPADPADPEDPLSLSVLAAARAAAVRDGIIPAALRLPAPRPDYTPQVHCPTLVARLGRQRDIAPPTGGGYTRWGAQVAGHPRRAVAMRQYARIKGKLPSDLRARGPVVVVRRFAARGRLPIHAVMFPAGSHGEAQQLCKRVAAALAPCVVVKNG